MIWWWENREGTRILLEPENVVLGNCDELELLLGRTGKKKAEEQMMSRRKKIGFCNVAEETEKKVLLSI